MSLLPLFNHHTIAVGGGVELFAVDAGDVSKPTIVFLHGYPDDHTVWSYQMQTLARDYHVVSFDLRGMGKSTAPAHTRDYRIASHLEDITRVIRTLAGVNKKVHLVGHDWGSIIGWHFVTHPDYSQQYVLSYSTLSGPHLGMAAQFLQTEMFSRQKSRMRNSLKQILKSWYIGFFQIPLLPEKILNAQGLTIWKRLLKNNGVRALDAYVEMADETETVKNLINGLNLYRANFLKKPYQAPLPGSVVQPVQLFIANNDAFLAPETFDNIPNYAPSTTRVPLDVGHWGMREQPDVMTRHIQQFIAEIESA